MKVTVSNFQSLKAATLDVEGLTVIVGPSDLGKSAVVRAIEGALFNLAGDFFVRAGESFAEVTLTGVPTATGVPLDVVWRKGKTRNEFEIDGARYDKVGTEAPPPLPAAGYRDVGEDAIRPQVASQFDRLFLLDRPGSVVADILTALSRVMVVTTADRLCATDVRETKRKETLRRADLLQAERDVADTVGVEALHERMARLEVFAERVAVEEARSAQVRAAVTRRQALTTLDLRPLPPPVEVAPVQERGRILAALVPLAARRLHLREIPTTLPPVTETDTAKTAGERLTQLRGLLWTRTALLRSRGLVLLPAVSPERYAQLLAWSQQAADLRAMVTARSSALGALFTATATARAATDEAQGAQETFEAAMHEAGVCPLCGRPAS